MSNKAVFFVKDTTRNVGKFFVSLKPPRASKRTLVLRVPHTSTNHEVRAAVATDMFAELAHPDDIQPLDSWRLQSKERAGDHPVKEVILFRATSEDALTLGRKLGLEVCLLPKGVYL